MVHTEEDQTQAEKDAQMTDIMKALGAFPTWAIVSALLPFLPKTHPWYRRTFSLRDWHAHQTPLCRAIDVLFYASWACFAALLALLMSNG